MNNLALRTVIRRINRKLAHEDERIVVARGVRTRTQLGDFYAICVSRNVVTAEHVDPEAWARELGVLREFEQVVWD